MSKGHDCGPAFCSAGENSTTDRLVKILKALILVPVRLASCIDQQRTGDVVMRPELFRFGVSGGPRPLLNTDPVRVKNRDESSVLILEIPLKISGEPI